jgi:hypothetical protein
MLGSVLDEGNQPVMPDGAIHYHEQGAQSPGLSPYPPDLCIDHHPQISLDDIHAPSRELIGSLATESLTPRTDCTSFLYGGEVI